MRGAVMILLRQSFSPQQLKSSSRRLHYQFHQVIAHRKVVSLIQTSAALSRPENNRMHVACLTPGDHSAQKLRSNSSAAGPLLNVEVRNVRVMFGLGSR